MAETDKTDETLMPGVFVRLTPEQDSRVRRLAAEEERPLGTTLRRLIAQALASRNRKKAA